MLTKYAAVSAALRQTELSAHATYLATDVSTDAFPQHAAQLRTIGPAFHSTHNTARCPAVMSTRRCSEHATVVTTVIVTIKPTNGPSQFAALYAA
jgi:hypothetical protein